MATPGLGLVCAVGDQQALITTAASGLAGESHPKVKHAITDSKQRSGGRCYSLLRKQIQVCARRLQQHTEGCLV